MGASENECLPQFIKNAPIMNCPDGHELVYAMNCTFGA